MPQNTITVETLRQVHNKKWWWNYCCSSRWWWGRCYSKQKWVKNFCGFLVYLSVSQGNWANHRKVSQYIVCWFCCFIFQAKRNSIQFISLTKHHHHHHCQHWQQHNHLYIKAQLLLQTLKGAGYDDSFLVNRVPKTYYIHQLHFCLLDNRRVADTPNMHEEY